MHNDADVDICADTYVSPTSVLCLPIETPVLANSTIPVANGLAVVVARLFRIL